MVYGSFQSARAQTSPVDQNLELRFQLWKNLRRGILLRHREQSILADDVDLKAKKRRLE